MKEIWAINMSPSAEKTIVLHVGRHKTGTTSIQRAFKNNHLNLKKRGLLYPKSLPGCHSAFLIDAFGDPERHPVHGRFGRTSEKILADSEARLKKIRHEIRHFEGDRIVFSGEDAGTSLTVPHLERLQATIRDICGADVKYKILYFSRDPLSRAESGIQQLIKANGMTEEDARDFQMQGGGKRYAQIYDTYAEAFGEDSVEFHSYEVGRSHPDGLIAYFMNTIGVSFIGLKSLTNRTNTSISGEVLMFLSWLYEGPRVSPDRSGRLQFRATRAPINEQDKAILFSLQGERATFLSAKDKQQIWDVVSDDMAFLKNRFGIEYDPPAGRTVPSNILFGPTFLKNLEAALPELNSELRAEFLQFLQTHGHLTASP